MTGCHDVRRAAAPVLWVAAALLTGACAPAGAIGFETYTVQDGDTPASVAEALGIPVPGLLAQVGSDLSPGREISVNPPGEAGPGLASQFVETTLRFQEGDTLLELAATVNMSVEEFADFNGIPRRYHLVEGETIPEIVERYADGLQPIADAHQTSPEELLRGWNDIDEMETLPEGLLLTVGWENPRPGDMLAYPLVEKLREEVIKSLLKANGGLFNGEEKLWSDEVDYTVYVVKEKDTLESIAKTLKSTAEAIRDANDLPDEPVLTPGQPLFVPEKAAKAIAAAMKLYQCTSKKDTAFHSKPETGSPKNPVQGGKTFYVFWSKYDGWFPALTGSDDPKKVWAWVPASDVEVDLSQFYYAPGVPAPKAPTPEMPYGPGLIPAHASGRIQELLRIAYTYKGVPYLMGGESRRHIDCSAFVQTCFRQIGVRLPRTALTQHRVGRPVPRSQIAPGDRLYFDFNRKGRSGRTAPGVADHTGIFIGGGQFIHATPPRARINKLSGRYVSNLLGIRRDT